MITRRPLAALVIPLSALALAACDTARAPAPEGDAAATGPDAAVESPMPAASPTADTSTDSGVNDGEPDLTPADLTPEAEKGEKGARNVLLSFIRAIELKEFDQAYDLMRENAPQSPTKTQFAAMFDGFGTITVKAPTGTMEGAAGTLYYTAPTTITGSNGQTLTGNIVLNRVNDVPGATPEQLRWRVYQFDVAKK